MPHIALVPEYPLHPKEHITLCWMPESTEQEALEAAESFADFATSCLHRLWWNAQVYVTGHAIMSSHHVAMVQAPINQDWLRTLRVEVERLGLHRSQYKAFSPHISAPARTLLRPVGSTVKIVRAEFRP